MSRLSRKKPSVKAMAGAASGIITANPTYRPKPARRYATTPATMTAVVEYQDRLIRPIRAPPSAARKASSAAPIQPGRAMRSPASIWDRALACTSTPGVPPKWPGRKRSGVMCMSSLMLSESACAERVTEPISAIRPRRSSPGSSGMKAAE